MQHIQKCENVDGPAAPTDQAAEVAGGTTSEPKAIQLRPLRGNELVSVITPCYNTAHFIAQAMESVARQSYKQWEMVICDDGSTDDSVRRIKEFAGRDVRFRLVRQANLGAAAATNRAFTASQGQVIAFLDADDLFLPSKLERCMEKISRSRNCGLLTHRLEAIDGNGRSTGKLIPGRVKLAEGWMAPFVFDQAEYGVTAPSSGNIARREVLEQAMPIPEFCRRTQDAYLIWCALLTTQCAAIEEVLGAYRVHTESQTGQQPFTAAYYEKRIQDILALRDALLFFSRRQGYTSLGCHLQEGYLRECTDYWRHVACFHLVTGQTPSLCPTVSLAQAIARSGRWSQTLRAIALLPLAFRRLAFASLRARYRLLDVFKGRRRSHFTGPKHLC